MSIAMLEHVSNVSLSHQAPLEVLRDHPEAVLELLRIAGRLSDETKLAVVVLDTELAEAVPSTRRADLVVLLEDEEGRAHRVVVVEIQRKRDDKKLLAWPLYVAYLHSEHHVSVTLLVITFDAATAAWARTPYDTGSLVLSPLVLAADDLPEIASVDDALAHRDISMLTALARLGTKESSRTERQEAEVARVFEALLRAEVSPVRSIYLSMLHGASKGALRGMLEKLLEAYGMGALEMIYNDGKAEGKAEGEAVALLKVLRARGLQVDAAAEARIRQTRDLALLDLWLERAAFAATVGEVLAD